MKIRSEFIRKASIAVVLLLVGIVLIWYSGIATIKSSSVIVRNEGVKLDASVAMPRWATGPVPAIVIVHGPGRVRRDDLRSFVRTLVPQGYAVLTFDKRGVGRSSGVFTRVTVDNSETRLREMAADVSAAVSFLAEQEDIDTERIALIGARQAGWIMPIVANENSNVAHFVSLSGDAVSVGQAVYFSKLADESAPQSDVGAEYESFSGPHGFDPLASLMNMEIPSLWLMGERDENSPIESTERILSSLPTPGLFDVQILPNVDHDLRDVDTGDIYDYWPTVLEWLSRH